MASKAWALAAAIMLASSSLALPSTQEVRERIHAALVVGGFDDAVVDVGGQRVLIVYEQPPATADQMIAAWVFMAGAAAQASPTSQEVVIVAASGGEEVMRVTVRTQDYLDFRSKKIDAAAFQSRVKSELTLAPRRACQMNSYRLGGECVCEGGFEKSGEECVPPAGSSSGGAWCLLGGFGLGIVAAAGAFAVLGAAVLFWKRRKGK